MKTILVGLLLLVSLPATAAIKVVTSLSDLAELAQRIGGDKVKAEYIVQPDQNPHFVEVKPSYMMRLKSADVFLTIGMELELWGPQLIDGSRNSHLKVVDLSQAIQKLEVPTRVDASEGDVHRFGNPHYWLDPRNIRPMADEIVAALSSVSPSDAGAFRANADAYLRQLDAKIASWEAQAKPIAGAKIITFHKSWTYFTDWLKVTVVGQVEPKPGIVPSPSHTVELIQQVRSGGIKVIVVEPFYDTSAPDQIARATGATVLVLPTSSGKDNTSDYISMMDHNVTALIHAVQGR